MRFVACVIAIAGFVPGTLAEDWPQWRGPDRDCRVPAQAAWPDSLDPGTLTRSWSVPLGPSYSGPLVVGDRVIVTETRDKSHEVVRALDRSSGEELWQVEWPGAMTVPFFASANGSWIRSTPASDGERVFVVGIRDVLVCLDIKSGDELWRIDFTKKFGSPLPSFGAVCSPILDGDFLFIQASSSVVKIRKNSGDVVWRVRSGDGTGMTGSAFSSPVIGTVAGRRQLLVQSRQALAGLDLETGERLWSQPITAFRGMNILTPTIISENTLFTSTYGGGSFLIQVTQKAGSFTAKQVWKTNQQGYMSSPVLIGGDVYLHLRNQRFCCLNPQDGKSRWTTRPFGKYWSMAVNGDRILALDQKGELLLIDASREKFNLVSRRRVSNDESWAHVAVADNTVFVRELNAMTVWLWKDGNASDDQR